MDDLTTLANQRGRGLRIFQGLIAEDATGPNDVVPVRIPSYEPSRQFGPCNWAPRVLNDGSPLWPNRNDGCLVALDENDQAEIINWWADDPTSLPPARWVEYGPYTADGGELAANAEGFVPMFHNIPGLEAAPDARVLITGWVYDGHDSSHCSWRADIDNSAVYIVFANNRVGGTAHPFLRFTIKVKVS